MPKPWLVVETCIQQGQTAILFRPRRVLVELRVALFLVKIGEGLRHDAFVLKSDHRVVQLVGHAFLSCLVLLLPIN